MFGLNALGITNRKPLGNVLHQKRGTGVPKSFGLGDSAAKTEFPELISVFKDLWSCFAFRWGVHGKKTGGGLHPASGAI